MKVNIIFNEDEKETALAAIKVGEYISAVYDFEQYLRQIVKYAEESVHDEAYAEREKIREKFYECFGDLINV